ncbi:hypothetical protein [Streptomyces noursei]|uniref:hypothetical protein n=1 Tax=Streptomyces noursei TaxID=1971 RepID=UPI0021A81CD5|nr:hypothetical protein [Streptomyces noursei]UWS69869.1 hypothetical protein N1H47_00395 [Streptomyces noursei]
MVIYLVAHGCNQIDIARLAGRHAKVAPSPWLRRGLRLVAVSGWFSIAYVSSHAGPTSSLVNSDTRAIPLGTDCPTGYDLYHRPQDHRVDHARLGPSHHDSVGSLLIAASPTESCPSGCTDASPRKFLSLS